MTTQRKYGTSPFNVPGEFIGIDFSPDSRHLWAVLFGDENSQLVAFDVESGEVASQRELEGRLRSVYSLPGGAAMVGGWGLIRRVSAKGKTEWALKGVQDFHLAAMNAKRSMFVSIEDGEILVRDAKNTALIHTLQETEGDVYAVTFSADGALMATGSSKGIVRLYDVHTGKERAKRKSTKVLALAFSPSGEHLLVGHGNGAVELWTVQDLKPVRGSVGHHKFDVGGGAGCRWVAFSPDGTRAYSLGNELVLRSWSVPDFDAGPVIEVPDRHMQGSVTALSPDGRWLATGTTPGALSVWSTEDGSARTGAAAPSPILGLALMPDAVVATSNRTCVSWELDTGKATEIPANFPPTDVKALSSGVQVRLDYDSIFVGKSLDAKARESFKLSSYASGPLAISRDETRLAAPAQENVQVWVLKRALLQADLPHKDRVRACAFGPKDAWLATADKALHLWRLGKTPEVIREVSLGVDTMGSRVCGLAVSPRGWIAVSVADDDRDDANSVLLLVDPRSGETVSRLERHDAVLGQVAFVGDARVAVADSLGRLLMVDVANPAKARWLGPDEVEPRPDALIQEVWPLARLGDSVAYVGPDGSVVVETLKPAKVDDGEPFLLEAEVAPKRGGKAKNTVTGRSEDLFEKRLAGTRFLFVGRFRNATPAFREGLLKELGAEVAAKPDAKVTHLVLGVGAAASVAAGLTAKGAQFKKLSENELMKLLLPTSAEATALLRNEVKDSAERWNSWRERYRKARGSSEFSVLLQGIDLAGRDLSGYELLELDFTEGRFSGVDFSKVYLGGANFRHADVSKANFSGGSCTQTIFTGANLRGARFENAELMVTCFDGADLRDVDFSKAKLHWTDFSGADLTGATMSSDLKDLKYDAKTKWPKGFKP
ncbi:pentapeptide repeat-containing protein [Pyxidicoccus parkwayensis]|uniref:Pentapeptide repeat-containing protein n=1 Tax=Pyxidicoccus parkwayensis TaxID=2813578 RepID=A0ABX7PAF9_9BACT|nr:pentapeptide repeat-containing protein [Pyxidicoccus parkwaysis]QSQ27460.1 pentapeptide repeat-containing protein [Pyxidicoccus parkwaysis]